MEICNPYKGTGTYRKAQLHVHTNLSDGDLSPLAVLTQYKKLGFSFVALTDHDRVTRCRELDDHDFVTILGEENSINRYFRPYGRHMLRLFVNHSLDEGDAASRIEQTAAAGGMVALCHPSGLGWLRTGRWRHQFGPPFRLLEIFNHHSCTKRDLKSWHACLRHFGPQAPVWGIAVDDMHTLATLGRGWIMVKVTEITKQALFQALDQGAFYATTGPLADFGVGKAGIEVRSEAASIRFIDADALIRQEVQGTSASYAPQGDEGFIRVEVVCGQGVAWSQPFWLQ